MKLILIQLLIAYITTPSIRGNEILLQNEPSESKSFRDPRSEMETNITTGEQAWLNQLKSAPAAIVSTKETDDRVVKPPPSLFQKKKAKRERLKRSSRFQTIDENLVRNEFHPLSEHHSLTQTTSIDRSTVARIHNLAHDGSIDSLYFLGLIYLYGLNNMVPNPQKATNWFQKAAEAGHAEGQCALGLILYHGLGDVEQDKKSAMYWFYRASLDSKHARAYFLLGRSLYEGSSFADIDADIESLTSTLGISSQDYVDAGNQGNFLLAAHLFQKANMIHEAIHHLAIMFEYGLVPEKTEGLEFPRGQLNYSKAAELYQKAANLGSTESLYNLGLMHTYGRGFPVNYIKAKNLYQQATAKKHAPSMRYLALLALNGWGQRDDIPNSSEAIYWLKQCIKNRNEEVEGLCERELKELKRYVNESKEFVASQLRSLHE